MPYKNPLDKLQWQRDARKKNREKYREYDTKCKRKQRLRLHAEIIKLLGGKCSRCGFSDRRALQIDHINDNGKEEREKYGSKIYRKIRKAILAGSKDINVSVQIVIK